MIFSQYPPQQGTVVEKNEVSLAPLAGHTVAIIGYGTMGRAHALNLQRSGIDVVVGVRAASSRKELALREGLRVLPTSEAVALASIVMLMLPDEAMAAVYESEIVNHLQAEAVLGFAHGFAIAFDQINPGPDHSCFLAAPKGQGDMLLEAFAAGGGVPGLLAVTDSSADSIWDLAAAYAAAVGCLEGGGFVTSFRQECISDQFGEQVVLCGGVLELVKSAFDIMVEAGYGEENAYFECVHELKLITDLLHTHGLDGMREKISGTASYGGLTRGPRIIDDGVRDRMRQVLGEIESGQFAREMLDNCEDPAIGTAALSNQEKNCALVQAGKRVLPRLHPDAAQPKQ